MNMMKTDVTCEPLQHLGQFIERAAVHTGLEKFPFLVAFPIGGIEIMLDVEQPDPGSAGDQQNGQFHQ